MNPFPQYFVWSNFKKVMGSLKSTIKISERKENAIIRNIVCAYVCIYIYIYIYQWKVRIQYINSDQISKLLKISRKRSVCKTDELCL